MTQQESNKGTVLLVEDDLALRGMLHHSLEMQGYKIIEADSKQTALECLNKISDEPEEIGVMILDLGLPPMAHTTDEGLAVIRQVSAELHPTKIIVLTGQDEEKSAFDAISEGAFDFLSKPAKFENILSAVERAYLFYRKEQDMSEEGMTRLQFNAKTSDGLKAVREEAEEKLVRQVLKQTGFNVYQSAAKLGVKRESIYYFMKKFGISRDNS